jgi:hypothetical protein
VGDGFECGASLTRSTWIWQEPESRLRKERGKVGEGSPRKGTKLVEVQLPTSTDPLCHANGPPPGELTANYIHVLSFAIKS